MNGLIEEFRELKKIFPGKFIITREVKLEIIDRPLNIKRFELEALKLNQLLDDHILEMPSVLGVNENKISDLTAEIHNVANNTFFGRENAIHIIDLGEESCIALSKMLNDEKIINVISTDERTVRILCEKPENLRELLRKRLHTSVNAKTDNYKYFKGFRFIRSAELIYLAYKKGLVKLRNHDVLDALLYAMKFNGCAISDDVIAEMKRMK